MTRAWTTVLLTGAAPPEPPLLLRLVPVLVLLGLVGWGLRSLYVLVPRLRRALPADGVVVQVGEQAMPEPGPAWRLTVEFVRADGGLQRAVWVGNSSVDLTRYRPGMRVPVRYDPLEPRWVHLPGSGRPHPLIIPTALVLLPLLVAPVLLLSGALG